jgi:hypothetical protein
MLRLVASVAQQQLCFIVVAVAQHAAGVEDEGWQLFGFLGLPGGALQLRRDRDHDEMITTH